MKRLKNAVILILVPTVLGLSVATIILDLALRKPHLLHMTPGDTRIINKDYTPTLCPRLTLTNTGITNNIAVNISILNVTPQLDSSNNFTIDIVNLLLRYNMYQYWRFYIHSGSVMMVKACILVGGTMQLDIVNSTDFKEWIDGIGGRRKSIETFSIEKQCGTGQMDHFDYTFKKEGDYYFAFLSPGKTHSDIEGLSGALTFTRTEYGIPNNSIMNNGQCTTGRAGTPSCTVTYHSRSNILISAEAISFGTYSSSAAVDVEVNCSSDTGLIIGIVVGVLVGLVLIAIAISCCFKSCRNFYKRCYKCMIWSSRKCAGYKQLPNSDSNSKSCFSNPCSEIP